jgi:hypothetical protein
MSQDPVAPPNFCHFPLSAMFVLPVVMEKDRLAGQQHARRGRIRSWLRMVFLIFQAVAQVDAHAVRKMEACEPHDSHDASHRTCFPACSFLGVGRACQLCKCKACPSCEAVLASSASPPPPPRPYWWPDNSANGASNDEADEEANETESGARARSLSPLVSHLFCPLRLRAHHR